MGVQPLAVVGRFGRELDGTAMDEPHALAALAALGQPTRLAIFRVLIRMEPKGMSAGALAEKVGCPNNTLSTHVAILTRAGLVIGAREGRTVIYRPNAAGTQGLIAFLVNDCCDGRPELCSLSSKTNGPCATGPGTQPKKTPPGKRPR